MKLLARNDFKESIKKYLEKEGWVDTEEGMYFQKSAAMTPVSIEEALHKYLENKWLTGHFYSVIRFVEFMVKEYTRRKYGV